MLPDFPVVKGKLERRLLLRFEQRRNSELGLFGAAPSFGLSEGGRLIFVDENGVEREIDFKHAEASFSISAAELPNLTPDQLVAKLDRVASEIAKQQREQAITELTNAVDAVGNRLDARGEPLAAEHILKMLERISIDFTDSGLPELPAMVVHPDQASRAAEVMAQIQGEPALAERYGRIIAAKREEWRARESRRKLVG